MLTMKRFINSVLVVAFIFCGYSFAIHGQETTDSNNSKESFSSPVAVPVLTPEEAEIANLEAIQLKDADVIKANERTVRIREWRQKDCISFLKKFLLTLLCTVFLSIVACLVIKRKNTQKKDLLKASFSAVCAPLVLLLIYAAIPYFYKYWSVGNFCLACIIGYLFFRYYDKIFRVSRKDIIFFPLLLLGTLLLLYYVNPRMRDIPNTIILDAETTDSLIYEGTISEDSSILSKEDFLAHYNFIDFNEGWSQNGSYRATLEKGKGRLTLHLPTELIQKYKLAIKLTSSAAGAKGKLSVNGYSETPWQMNSSQCYLALYDEQHLFPGNKYCPVFFLFLCLSGVFLSLLFLLRLTEEICSLYYFDRKKAFELVLLIVCVLFCVANIKNALFIDNNPDMYGMASNVTKKFSTKHPPMIYVWWMAARFISPFESINASFAFGTLISFWGGIWLLGSFLIRCKQPLFAFLMILPCINLVSSTMYQRIRVDLIVVSVCLLTIGLCTRVCSNSKTTRIVLSIIISAFIMVLSTVRLEGLSYTVPISILFVSLVFFKKMKRLKRVFLSGLVGSILALSLFSVYRFVISPYVFHAKPDKAAAVDNILREALGICYFSQDWDDLPEMFSDEAKKALDRTRFIEYPKPYRFEYLPKASMKQIQNFWFHMVKKHPFTYLKVKWVGNQVLWRCRTPYAVPFNIKAENDPTKTGLSVHNFFKDGITTCGLILPSWLLQLSLLFVFLFVGILLLRFNDVALWVIWSIGASGFLHNFAFFLISGAPNYRYIFWADISGGISFILSILVIHNLLEYKRKEKNGLVNTNNLDNIPENSNEALYTDSLF